MWIFVNALIENPAFDSQTKECLTLKSSAFGSKCELSEDFVKKGMSRLALWQLTAVSKSGIIDNVLNWAKFKQDQILKKSDGTKRTRLVRRIYLQLTLTSGYLELLNLKTQTTPEDETQNAAP